MRRGPGWSGWTPRSREGASQHDAATVRDQGGRRCPRRSARPTRARALARRAPGGGLALRHERRVHEGAGRALAPALRLAHPRGAAQQAPQFTVALDGIDVHFIHEPGVGPAPMPLLLSHGWPGSIVEFERILPMLTDPGRFGGEPADAFTVVAPSLPGYGFSFKPNQPRFGVEEIADTFARLMTDVLGYRRFAAQGGDWGAL